MLAARRQRANAISPSWFINNSTKTARLLAGGERTKSDNRIYYPLNDERRSQMPWSEWWEDVPNRERGSHSGKPTAKADVG
jgi:uncharacterized cupin superfamily protein